MKKLVLHMVLVLLTVSVYSQGSYVHSDSVDSLMFKYLNMYRVSNGLKPLRMDTVYKSSCVSWGKGTSDSVSVDLDYMYRMNHTFKAGNHLEYYEVVTAGVSGYSLSDSTSSFSKFVKKVCGKGFSTLTETEVLVLVVLYSWDQSTPHNKALNNPNLLKGFSSVYFRFSRPYKGKFANYLRVEYVGVAQVR